MTTSEITQNQIEYLAWKIIAFALEFIDQDLYLADLHPGEGQYDCLSLVTNNGDVTLMLNRNGTSAASPNGLVENIWEEATKNGARLATVKILTDLDIEMRGESDNEKVDLRLTCRRMARWVRQQSNKKGKPLCCWVDDTYSVGTANYLLSQVKIPPTWANQVPPYKSTDWSAWLFALTIDEKVIGLVNMKTGDAINSDGTRMVQWYEKKFSIPAKQNKKSQVFAEPIESPTEEVLAVFRKVSSFNGYKVFGDELVSVAESVFANWLAVGELPEDIEKIKGALFFEFRRAHHTGQYPEGNDFLYIEALGTAIDKQT